MNDVYESACSVIILVPERCIARWLNTTNMAGLTAKCNAPIAGVKILITLVNILGLKGISLIKQPDEYIYPEPQLKLN